MKSRTFPPGRNPRLTTRAQRLAPRTWWGAAHRQITSLQSSYVNIAKEKKIANAVFQDQESRTRKSAPILLYTL